MDTFRADLPTTAMLEVLRFAVAFGPATIEKGDCGGVRIITSDGVEISFGSVAPVTAGVASAGLKAQGEHLLVDHGLKAQGDFSGSVIPSDGDLPRAPRTGPKEQSDAPEATQGLQLSRTELLHRIAKHPLRVTRYHNKGNEELLAILKSLDAGVIPAEYQPKRKAKRKRG